MIRLTGGAWNGRALKTPSSLKTRPSQARLRQALMNSLQFKLPGARVLDLFAGSGALGFEALSRGAEHCVFLDLSKPAVKVIEENVRDLKCGANVKVLEGNWRALTKVLGARGPFDLVFCDPPYAEGFEIDLLNELPFDRLLAPEGIFSLEWGKKKSVVDELPEETVWLEKIREKIYGDSILTHYQLKSGSLQAESPEESGED
jgi:16S rRNA (guanine966-N2)-methyltransferase